MAPCPATYPNHFRDEKDWGLECPSHTTVHAGPHTAVRRVELDVNSRAFDAARRQITIRSLPETSLGASLLVMSGRPNKIGFSAAGRF
jgi:hypothetical protein